MTVWLQALHGIRDNRINELARLGYRVAGLTAWCGNSVTPPKVHYNAGGSLQRWGFIATLGVHCNAGGSLQRWGFIATLGVRYNAAIYQRKGGDHRKAARVRDDATLVSTVFENAGNGIRTDCSGDSPKR
ncbi:MAG: hypothetical protein P1U77_11765 [Rubripirellula sp.]|nr:hypothetical protein [Rubripirellula sp.]